MGSDGEILFQRDLTIFLALENFVKPTTISQVLKLTNYQKSGTQEYGTIWCFTEQRLLGLGESKHD